jgi:hypothetical protein
MKQSLYLLWLEGLDPERLESIPALAQLKARGIDVRLSPLPPVEDGQCTYQALTGMGPGKFGRFDAVRPEGYRVVQESGVPEGVQGAELPELLRGRKLATASLEARSAADLAKLAGQELDFALVRLPGAGQLPIEELETLVQRALELATPSGHVLVLTSVQQSAPVSLVNINNFLVDVGLMEASEPSASGEIVWSETLAYSLGNGQIWVNLRGRELQGVVSSGREYQEVCEALVRELKTNWLDPQTQQPVVARAFKKDELYTGEYLFKAPDLVVAFAPGYAPSSRGAALQLDDQSVLPTGQSGPAKTSEARLLGSGSALAAGVTTSARLIDVAPAVLYLLDQAVPQRMDGEVNLSLFNDEYRRRTPLKQIEDEADLLSDEEEGLIVDRLRDLGYLG